MKGPLFELLIITDGASELLSRVERALLGAEPVRVALMLRRPGATASELLALALPLRALTRALGVALLVNDRIDVALAVGADGVHLPEVSFPPEVARQLLGPDAYLGASRHDAAGLASAHPSVLDYATLSPVHAVEGKAPPLGIDGFARLAKHARLPLFALGGVGELDVAPLREAGAYGVAVIREVLDARDPAMSTRRLLEALRASPLRSA